MKNGLKKKINSLESRSKRYSKTGRNRIRERTSTRNKDPDNADDLKTPYNYPRRKKTIGKEDAAPRKP